MLAFAPGSPYIAALNDPCLRNDHQPVQARNLPEFYGCFHPEKYHSQWEWDARGILHRSKAGLSN
jgi:hypothetical protein